VFKNATAVVFNIIIYHAKMRTIDFLVKGIGFFNDAYDLFVMNLVNVILKHAFCRVENENEIPEDCDNTLYDKHWKSSLSMAVFLGAVLGQVIFGILADKLGRRRVMVISCALLIGGGVLCASTYAPSDEVLLILLVCFRFALGVGIGAEYPLAASSSAEASTDDSRGRTVSLVFSLQGIGNLTASLCGYLIILAIDPHDPYERSNLMISWRILFAIGTLPAIFGFYFRWKAEEDETYQMRARGLSESGATEKMSFILKNYGWRLLGTAGSWFLFDVIFYAQAIFSATVLSELHMKDDLSDTALKNVFIALLALPGYYFSVCFIDRIGRKNLQMMGFTAMSVIFLTIGLSFDWIKDQVELFVFMYGLSFFFANFGPNTSTFIIPTESFPTAIRSTCHGISAAMGKVGAVVGVYSFVPFKNAYGQKSVFLACGGISVFCIFFTYAFVQNDIGELNKLEEEFLQLLKDEEQYAGAAQKQFLLLDAQNSLALDNIKRKERKPRPRPGA